MKNMGLSKKSAMSFFHTPLRFDMFIEGHFSGSEVNKRKDMALQTNDLREGPRDHLSACVFACRSALSASNLI